MASFSSSTTTTPTTDAIPIPREPIESEALTLFHAFEEKFPTKTLGHDKWYLVLLTALVGGGTPHFAPLLYQQLIQRPEYASAEQRQALMRRLRETLMKQVIIVGICKPLEAIMDIAAVVREEDRDYTSTREGWQCDEANYQRGAAWLGRLYTPRNLEGTINNTFEANKDFDWLTKNITYGLFLSDRSVLNDVETELTVVTGIMIQNLPRESAWHMRGCRRIGVAKEDLEVVRECVELVARFCGVSFNKVPRVEDIEHEV